MDAAYCCQSCIEIFNEKERTPRNLPCGHTYCEACLEKIRKHKGAIECPLCRKKLPTDVLPSALSKNFIAANLASKHQELEKKLQFCSSHNEPLQFFCETDKKNICAQCIIEHSGHTFVRQEHSIPLLKEKIGVLKAKVKGKSEEVEKNRDSTKNYRDLLVSKKEEQIKNLNDEFARLIKKIEEKKSHIISSFNKICEEELELLDLSLGKQESLFELVDTEMKMIGKIEERLEKELVIKDSSIVKQIKEAEESIDQKLDNVEASKLMSIYKIPSIHFNNNIYKEINNLTFFSNSLKRPRICFFGERNQILIYDIQKDNWDLKFIDIEEEDNPEFNYFSAATTLPNGNVLITGGGISRDVLLVNTDKFQIMKKAPMIQIRKEHSAIQLQNSVYAIGGFDGEAKIFLKTCEKYDIEKDEWRLVAPMKVPKCAFACTALDNRYIYVFGGYDGIERLNTIEKYDSELNSWETVPIKLPMPLSNAACCSPKSNTLIILGGGYSDGFSLEMFSINTEKNEITNLPKMNHGKDLRNKLVFFDGNIYAIGGNSCVTEKYSFIDNKWIPLRNYDHWANDNLDSWSCAFTFSLNAKSSNLNEGSVAASQQNVLGNSGFSDINNFIANYSQLGNYNYNYNDYVYIPDDDNEESEDEGRMIMPPRRHYMGN